MSVSKKSQSNWHFRSFLCIFKNEEHLLWLKQDVLLLFMLHVKLRMI